MDSVRRSLEKARTKFPKDRPSIIFMKVPQRWFEEPGRGVSLINIAETFLRGTGRIVSVKFYVSYIGYRDKALRQDHAFKEISNPDIDPSRDWSMFAAPGKRWLERNASKMEKTSFLPNDLLDDLLLRQMGELEFEGSCVERLYAERRGRKWRQHGGLDRPVVLSSS